MYSQLLDTYNTISTVKKCSNNKKKLLIVYKEIFVLIFVLLILFLMKNTIRLFNIDIP